jgi:hypothetical protein
MQQELVAGFGQAAERLKSGLPQFAVKQSVASA